MKLSGVPFLREKRLVKFVLVVARVLESKGPLYFLAHVLVSVAPN